MSSGFLVRFLPDKLCFFLRNGVNDTQGTNRPPLVPNADNSWAYNTKRGRKWRGSGEVGGWHKLLGDALSPFSIRFIAALVFVSVLTTLPGELYLGGELLYFKHKNKPPHTCHPPKAPRGYAHGSNKTTSFTELGFNNQHHYGLSSLVMNIKCFYQIINPFLCWFSSWKCRDCLLLN